MSRRSNKRRGKHRINIRGKGRPALSKGQKRELKESAMPNGTNELPVDLDKIFCMNARKYKLEKLWLKALGVIESNLNPRAYRFEQNFWEKYLKNHPDWKDRDPKIVSASHGIGQIMFSTAVSLGLTGENDEDMQEALYNPVINIQLMAKLLRISLDKTVKKDFLDSKFQIHPFALIASRYNGGSRDNPSELGKLRNQLYVDKVFKEWHNLRQVESECPED